MKALRVACLAVMALATVYLSGCKSPGLKSEALAGDLKKRIAVVDFIDKTDYGKGRLGIAATDMLEGELARTEKFTMVSHSGANEVLDLQALGQSGALEGNTVMQAGKLIGANAIINGSVSEFGIKKSGITVPGLIGTKQMEARAVVDILLIDGTTGVIMMSEKAEGKADTHAAKFLNIGDEGTYDETLAGKALRGAISNLVAKVVARLQDVPWQGYILSDESGYAFITGGTDIGIRNGMTFVVATAGRQMTAPNGKVYTLPGAQKGLLKVVEVMEDISKAQILEGTAKKDDLVRVGH